MVEYCGIGMLRMGVMIMLASVKCASVFSELHKKRRRVGRSPPMGVLLVGDALLHFCCFCVPEFVIYYLLFK